jgi:hypothetical protein
MKFRSLLLAVGLAAALAPALRAWDYEGHRMVNQVALAALPKEFPAFVHSVANEERVRFLAGEADRWRNVPDVPLAHMSSMEHYLDAEEIPEAGLSFATLPSYRYDFAVQFAAGRAAHVDKFPTIDPARNTDHSREWPGFAPWAITESYGRLRSAFSYLRAFEELGTPDEIANTQANIVYLMGVMGHYVGDCAQPLHTTIHHHGWVGPNPNGYSTWSGIHAWMDGGLIGKAGIRFPELAPQVRVPEPLSLAPRSDGRDPVFVAVLDYLLAQNRLVEEVYQLHKAGKLGDRDQPVAPEARAFVDHQLVVGGEMLATLWITAWRNSVPDNYLHAVLLKRQAAAAAPTAPAAAK